MKKHWTLIELYLCKVDIDIYCFNCAILNLLCHQGRFHPHTFLCTLPKKQKKLCKVKQEAVKVLDVVCAWKFTTLAVSLHLRSDCINYAVPVSW